MSDWKRMADAANATPEEIARVKDAALSLTAKTRTVEVSQINIEAIESLSDAAIRSGDTQTAIEGYALALRLRSETGLHPQRRSTDAVT